MTNLDLIPPAFHRNHNARRLITPYIERALKEKRYGGPATRELENLIGVCPDTKKVEYTGDIDRPLEFADAEYLADPY